jgi:cholesterol transport system auxiliary component
MMPRLNSVILTAMLGISWLAGCGSILPTGEDGKKPPQRFSLGMTAQDIPASITSAIRVEDFDSPAELALDRIVVRRGVQEVLYAKGARWTDKPSRLMRNLISDYLKAASQSIVASPTQIDVPIVYRLSGRLSAFQVRVEGTPTATVRFEALLNNTRSRVPVSRVFTSEAPASSDSPAAMAAAINVASNQVAADVTSWMIENAK